MRRRAGASGGSLAGRLGVRSLRLRGCAPERRSGRTCSGLEGVGGSGVNSLDNLLGVALVELHQFGEIELGFLEHLDLLDEHVLEWVDLGAVLGDLLDDGVGKAKMIYYLLTYLTHRERQIRHLQVLEEIFEG